MDYTPIPHPTAIEYLLERVKSTKMRKIRVQCIGIHTTQVVHLPGKLKLSSCEPRRVLHRQKLRGKTKWTRSRRNRVV